MIPSGLEAFTPESIEKIRRSVGEIKQERARVIEGLKTIEAVRHIFPSNANFVLFRMDHSYGVYKAVADLGVCSLLFTFFFFFFFFVTFKALIDTFFYFFFKFFFFYTRKRLSQGIVARR